MAINENKTADELIDEYLEDSPIRNMTFLGAPKVPE